MTGRGAGATTGVQESLVERQGCWQELRRRAVGLAHREGGGALHPAVAISRQAGAGGSSLASLVGRRLGWQVLDRDLLAGLSEELSLDRELLRLVDETRLSWFGESVFNLIEPHVLSQDEYLARLVRLVFLALAERPAVVVGRGAHAFLPRETTVAVRVVADEADRISHIASLRSLDQRAARRWVEETDSARAAFVRHHFGMNIAALEAYDLVVNTSRMHVDQAAGLVAWLCRMRAFAVPERADAIGERPIRPAM